MARTLWGISWGLKRSPKTALGDDVVGACGEDVVSAFEDDVVGAYEDDVVRAYGEDVVGAHEEDVMGAHGCSGCVRRGYSGKVSDNVLCGFHNEKRRAIQARLFPKELKLNC